VNTTAQVRAFLRARGSRPRTWSDRYITLFGLILVAMLASPMIGSAVSSTPRDVDPARAGAGLALISVLLAGSLVVARALGPVATSAADAAWLVLSPLPRRSLLARTLLILAAVCTALGIILAAALVSAFGAPDAPTLRVLAYLVLGMSWTLGGMAAAVLAQASQPRDGWLAGVLIALVVVAVAMTIMSLGPGQRMLAEIGAASAGSWTAAGSVSAAVAAGLAGRAWAVVARMPVRAVLDASHRRSLATGAFAVMDPGSLTWIAEDAHWRSRALRSRGWPMWLRGAAAVAWLDWRRLARRPGHLAAMAATTVLPALVAQAGGGTRGALVVLAVGAMAVAATGTAGARRDAGDAALARLLGTTPRTLLAARAILPALLAGCWLTPALAGLDIVSPGGPHWPLGLLCAPALAAGALRAARRRPIDHSLPVMDTPFGLVPTGPMTWALASVDVAVLGCLPALAAFAGGVSGPLIVAQGVWGAAVLVTYCAAARRR
jgi:hypothetical protein